MTKNSYNTAIVQALGGGPNVDTPAPCSYISVWDLMKMAEEVARDRMFGAAEKFLRRAYTQAPQNNFVLGSIVTYFLRTDQYEKALMATEEKMQVEKASEWGFSYGLKAEALSGLGRYQEALDAIALNIQFGGDGRYGRRLKNKIRLAMRQHKADNRQSPPLGMQRFRGGFEVRPTG